MSAKVISVRGHHFYAGAISKDSVVVDLGAHLGEFATVIHRLFGCQCYAVEAFPALYTRIRATPSVKKFNYAVAEVNGPVTMYVARNPESHSLHRLPNGATEGTMTVNGVTLESFLHDHNLMTVDLLKVDIEGAEFALFRSLSDETVGRIKQITVEFHDFLTAEPAKEQIRAIKQRLRSLGFFCIVFSLTDHTNVLFVNVAQCDISLIERFSLKYLKKYFEGGKRLLQRKVHVSPISQ